MKKHFKRYPISIKITLNNPTNTELLEDVIVFLEENKEDDKKSLKDTKTEGSTKELTTNKIDFQHALNDAISILKETIYQSENSFVNQQSEEVDLILSLKLSKACLSLGKVIKFLKSSQSDPVDLARLYGVPYDTGYHGKTYGYVDPFDYALKDAITVLQKSSNALKACY